MKLTISCKTCNKPIKEIQSEFQMGLLVMYVWNCGHTELRERIIFEPENIPSPSVGAHPIGESENSQVQKLVDSSYASIDGSMLAYDFQVDGINFVENSGFNALIADAMGLGKTIQALLTLKRNKKHLVPCLIIVKSSLIFQWTKQLKAWASEHPLAVMPVLSRDQIIPGFGTYIISMDLLGRKGIVEKLSTLGIKFIILDESHSFKDPESSRTRALIKFIKENGIKYKLALSGTPIKNRASEYFTILNLLAPEYFPSLAAFKRRWLIQNEKGVYTRINPYRMDEFKELTSKWIIRREKHEVLTNLPPLTRDYQFIEIEEEGIKDSYNKTVNLFNNFLNSETKLDQASILGWLARLRAITGQAKCQAAIDFTEEFTDSTDENLAIGIQHTSVRDTLYAIFEAGGLNPLKLSGEDNSYRKDRIVSQFEQGLNRVLVINMIAGGVGLNLQCCANALVLERQWNAADEEQFEGRFHRDGQVKGVKITYMIARGTIDEFFHEMVEEKRKIFGETLIKNWALTSDEGALKELTEKVRYSKL